MYSGAVLPGLTSVRDGAPSTGWTNEGRGVGEAIAAISEPERAIPPNGEVFVSFRGADLRASTHVIDEHITHYEISVPLIGIDSVLPSGAYVLSDLVFHVVITRSEGDYDVDPLEGRAREIRRILRYVTDERTSPFVFSNAPRQRRPPPEAVVRWGRAPPISAQ